MADIHETSGDGATVNRWTKYGHDRLYVTAADRTRLGWLDLKTGDLHVEADRRAGELHNALAGHPLGRHATAAPPTASAASADGPPPPSDPPDTAAAPVAPAGPTAPFAAAAAAPQPHPASPPPASPPGPTPQAKPAVAAGTGWVDLAANRPGQGAREQADQHLTAMRERSRVGTFLARALDVKTDERAWRTGAKGEESIGGRLERLADGGWRVLHSVPVGDRGSDIDHVLIGPGGVYTVNTKNHPGKSIWISPTQVRVDGHPVPYLRNSRFEADRAKRLLSAALGWEPPVRPVLILLTGTLIPDVTIKGGGPDDVLILDRMDVPGAFKRSPARITAEQVDAIYEVARRSTTWTRRGTR